MMFKFALLLSLGLAAHASAEVENIYCRSLKYVGKDDKGLDAWCQATCTQQTDTMPGFCPADLCKCKGDFKPAPKKFWCKSPRKCVSGKYKANKGSNASDGWCQAVCETGEQCPCKMCLCAA